MAYSVPGCALHGVIHNDVIHERLSHFHQNQNKLPSTAIYRLFRVRGYAYKRDRACMGMPATVYGARAWIIIARVDTRYLITAGLCAQLRMHGYVRSRESVIGVGQRECATA